VIDGQDSGGHEPRGADQGADADLDDDDEHVQVIATSFLRVQEQKQTSLVGGEHILNIPRFETY